MRVTFYGVRGSVPAPGPQTARYGGNTSCVEVHLSDVKNREEFRSVSVIADICVATVSGQGAEGYREALERLRTELQGS